MQQNPVSQLLTQFNCLADSEVNNITDVNTFYQKTRLLKVNSNQQGLYIEFSKQFVKYYSLAYYSKWTWREDTRFWVDKELPNAPLQAKTPYLDNIFWLNTNFSFEHVVPGKYKFYLMHLVYNNDLDLNLKIKVNDRVLYDNDYPDSKTISECENFMKNKSSPAIYTQEMCEIEITENDAKNGGANVKVEFEGNDQSEEKNNWYIHGGILQKENSNEHSEETSIENNELIKKLEEMKERLEKNKAHYNIL